MERKTMDWNIMWIFWDIAICLMILGIAVQD
jgi:hypothetical protein